MSTKLRQATGSGGRYLYYWCQGCKGVHQVVVGPDRWAWDGNREAPTFSPSVLTNVGGGNPTEPICHTFVRAGLVEFLHDCTHALAGQTLPLPDWPYADGEYGGVESLTA